MKFLTASSPLILVLSLINLCSSLSVTDSMSSSHHNPNKGAYWPSWTTNFPPSAIDTTLFTHYYYAFLSPNNITFKFEIDNPTALLLKNFTTTLHHKNPNLKTLFSIGGASEGPKIFSRMASSHKTRKAFIFSTIEVARKFEFDGIDLDWEFPQTPTDMNNFRHLIHEWRVEVKKESKATCMPQLLLSAATYYSPEVSLDNIHRKYPVDSINENLDWINAMCYDYRGSWDVSATGAPALLYDLNSNISTSYGLQAWIKAKIQREKLVMGLPLYGRTWQLKDPSLYGIGAPAVDVGPGNEGHMTYLEVEKFNGQNSAMVVFDLSTVSTYSVAGTSWIGYDDVRSVALKVAYARGQNLGGYFFWAVDGDQDWKVSKEASRTWSI